MLDVIRMSGCGSIMVSAKVSAGVSIQDVDPECRSKVSIQDDGPRCRSEVSIRGVDPRCRSEVLAALSIERTPLRNFFVFTFWTKPYIHLVGLENVESVFYSFSRLSHRGACGC